METHSNIKVLVTDIFRIGPTRPWKKFRYPSTVKVDGKILVVFYSNWKSKWDIYGCIIKNKALLDLNRITFDGGNYGPKLYFNYKANEYCLLWHQIKPDNLSSKRKVLFSKSTDFLHWSSPVTIGHAEDNCYPSLFFVDDKLWIVYSAGRRLFQKNKALYACSLENSDRAVRLDVGDYANMWRSDVIEHGGTFYCAFDSPEGTVVVKSRELRDWSYMTTFSGAFGRPRFSLNQAGTKLFLCAECPKTSDSGSDLCFTTIEESRVCAMVKITDDRFDNTRPGPLMETEANSFRLFFTSNRMGLETINCVEFRENFE